MGCRELNVHLYNYRTYARSDDCDDTKHYFFVCPAFAVQRDVLLNTLSTISSCTLATILYGWKSCSLEEYCTIYLNMFTIVLKLLNDTKMGKNVFVVNMVTTEWTLFRKNICKWDQTRIFLWQDYSLAPKKCNRIFKYVVCKHFKVRYI